MKDLSIGLPYVGKCSMLTLHFLLKGYILSYYEALEEDNFDRKYIIVELCPILMCLSLHPFFLEEAISVVSQDCLDVCELSFVWRIEVVEAQVEGLSFLINRNIHFASINV